MKTLEHGLRKARRLLEDRGIQAGFDVGKSTLYVWGRLGSLQPTLDEVLKEADLIAENISEGLGVRPKNAVVCSLRS